MATKCPACSKENVPDARFCAQCGRALTALRCPNCGGPMEPGFIAPIAPGGAHIRWFDTEPDFVLFTGQGEQLTNPPIYDGKPYGNRPASRCVACRIVSFRY